MNSNDIIKFNNLKQKKKAIPKPKKKPNKKPKKKPKIKAKPKQNKIIEFLKKIYGYVKMGLLNIKEYFKIRQKIYKKNKYNRDDDPLDEPLDFNNISNFFNMFK